MDGESPDSGSAAGSAGPAVPAPARAPLDELSDDDLLARCRGQAPGSEERSAASEVLVRRYTPLVRACVRPYRNSPELTEDLMQVGYLGLLKAIGNYDPAFGNGLGPYAVPCITGEIKRHFRDRRWQVRVTRPLQELLLELRGAVEDLVHELGRQPLERELAGRLGVTPERLREARLAALGLGALSLNVPVSEDDGSAEFGELLGGEDPGFDRATDMEAVERHWSELPRREQQVLLMRFYGNLSQEEVGVRLGISQMHVSRLQARGLALLRSRLSDQGDISRHQDETA